MSDSPLQTWGSAPYDERDLDAVLSGEFANAPDALRPVADTLAALCGPPAQAELDAEAAARAAFRTHAGGELVTRIPRARTVDDGSRPRSHRHRRRVSPRVRWQAVALIGGAAAAVAFVALSGVLSGHGGQQGTSQDPAASTTARQSATGSPKSGVLGSGATSHPTPTVSVGHQSATTPAASVPAPDPKTLCKEYFGFLQHSTGHKSEAEDDNLKQLSRLAHGKPRVYGYCYQLLGLQPGAGSDNQGTSGNPGNGNPSDRYQTPGTSNGSGHGKAGSSAANGQQ
jgi:hypothetical protein